MGEDCIASMGKRQSLSDLGAFHSVHEAPVRVHPALPGVGSPFAGGTELGSPCVEMGRHRIGCSCNVGHKLLAGCIVRDQQLPGLLEIRLRVADLLARGRSWAERLAFAKAPNAASIPSARFLAACTATSGGMLTRLPCG